MEQINLSLGRKFLFITDTHLREKSFTSMPNSLEIQNEMWYTILIPLVKKMGITDIVHTGDLVHNGIPSKVEFMSILKSIERLASTVDNFFLCIGNHEYLDQLNNPTIFAIQPTDKIKLPIYTVAEERIVQTPDIIRCGGLQINLAHYSYYRDFTRYWFNRQKDTTQNITVFHDDLYGQHQDKLPDILYNLYENLDIAIHGHIHKSYPPKTISIGNRSVTVYIPGSMSLTSSSIEEYHNKVTLPIVEVTEEGKIINSTVDIPILSEKLTIIKEDKSEEVKDVLNFKKKVKNTNLKIINIEEGDININADVSSIKNFMLSVNLPNRCINLSKELVQKPINLNQYLKISKGDEDKL